VKGLHSKENQAYSVGLSFFIAQQVRIGYTRLAILMGIANRKIESFVSEAARLDIREREREREVVRVVPGEPLSWKIRRVVRPGADTKKRRPGVFLSPNCSQIKSEKVLSVSE
jgi:hypothetical protein